MTTDWSAFFATRTSRMQASAIRELLKVVARPEVISFAGGIPANETLPVQAVAEACERILAERGQQALQYGPTEGYQPLRELIAEMYCKRGVQASPDNVLITTGSQQGLDLAGKTLINEGDPVIMELPTYVGALQAWRPYAPKFRGVPMDEQGLQIDQPGATQGAKLMYLIPNFQNPSGISLSLERRRRAIDLAHEHDFLLVEDDPYRELRYSGQDIPALVELEGQKLGAAWDKNGRILHFGTFSKTLAPGLRIGWTLAPSTLIHMFVLAKQGTDLHSATLSQFVAEDLLRNGTLEAGLPVLRDLYRERRDTMLDALQTYVGDLATWTRPDGGLFIWLTLHNGINTMELLAEALKRDVAFVSGDGFYFNGEGYDSLRLNFSCMSPDRIREGIRRLGTLIAEQQSKPATAHVR